jgi:rhamnosyltransferase
LQEGVRVYVLANDDHSTDDTRDILAKWAQKHELIEIPGSGEKLGSANRNFMHLLSHADIKDSDYVALCDQDDIWHPGKLLRAVRQMQSSGSTAYSSNIEAFWPKGQSQIIRKSHPLKTLDHIFSSPGPGCTFVFSRSLFFEIQTWVKNNYSNLNKLWVHDWILYAYARGAGHAWLIDDYVSMRYRQHGTNDIGANIGLNALVKRLIRIRTGLYQQDLLAIARIADAPPRLILALDRVNFFDRLWLICRVSHFRRNLKERFALLILFCVIKRASF